MSQIQTMKKTVNQLRQEANIQRIPVSQACDDLMKYCNEHQKTDVLVTGMSPSDNPYRDIKGCVIIWYNGWNSVIGRGGITNHWIQLSIPVYKKEMYFGIEAIGEIKKIISKIKEDEITWEK